ncbi:hypothetical protein NADFUDRAFT_53575 [Nadsonia fulvescens var. elongata DSM 6958]|uniref:NECAP PHear domain-containing protein n=1 Tax=Nadsonia fulvescens var. elongata DSM 6958 TaxID=857566 RepID=A0A1E3PD15_9ASCO|nr:hypothetical protein NADFUDRAFT_53575 [Nadsonia fulvescens var. elongata DSM 6958]
MNYTIFSTPAVNIYQIPPLKSNAGHRVADWDIRHPIWSGQLDLVEFETRIEVREGSLGDGVEGDPEGELPPLEAAVVLQDADTGQLFARCPLDTGAITGPEDRFQTVRSVLDSTRFYTLRVINPDDATQRVTLGVGFPERDAAIEFADGLRVIRQRLLPLQFRHPESASRHVRGGDGCDDSSAVTSATTPQYTVSAAGPAGETKQGLGLGSGLTANESRACAVPVLLPPPNGSRDSAPASLCGNRGVDNGDEDDDDFGEFVS